MEAKKYQFGDNLIYEIDNLNQEVFQTLTNLVNSETVLLKLEDGDFIITNCVSRGECILNPMA